MPRLTSPILRRHVVRGIGFFPKWLRREHFRTPSGVAISPDGEMTHPKALTAYQRLEVDDFLELMRLRGAV